VCTATFGGSSLNIILLGFTGPFLTGLVEVIGLKRTILACMGLLAAGTGLSLFMTAPRQLFITWGLMVGIGAGGGAVGIAAVIANRWFVARSGLAMGLLSAANAAGQLAFLPLLALLAEQYGWQGRRGCGYHRDRCDGPGGRNFAARVAGGYWARALRRNRRPRATGTIRQSDRNRDDNIVPRCAIARFLASDPQFRDLRVFDEWAEQHAPDRLLRRSRYWRSNRGQHFGDARSVQPGRSRGVGLAVRFNPRILLFWYYSLRGASLAVLPFSSFDVAAYRFSLFSMASTGLPPAPPPSH